MATLIATEGFMPETCIGCGAEGSHPMVGVGKSEDGDWAAWPVCAACHRDPAHRKRLLKMHFFDRAAARLAVLAARNQIMLETP